MSKLGKGRYLLLAAAAAVGFGAACTPIDAAPKPAAPKPAAPKPAAEKPSKRPNILFILIDDLRPDLGIYGHPVAKTPNMDALGKSGLVFDNAITQQAVCGPSRAALMTGLRPDTTNIKDLETPVDSLNPAPVTMLDMFRQAGYGTYGYGKIYHHTDDDADGWTKRVKDQEKVMAQADRRAKVEKKAFDRVPDSTELPDGKNVDAALADMRRLAKGGAPFFMAVGLHRPHLPFISPDSAWARYNPATVPGPVNPDGQMGAPPWALVSYEIWNYPNTRNLNQKMPKELADQFRWAYLAAVSYADDQVGRLMAELKKQGLENDTIVVLWSDHGWKLGDHDKWAKHSNADLDIHIPMMIRAPGLTQAGTRSTAMVESVDIYPTLASLAGLQAPSNLEGLSMTPLFSNPQRSWKQAAFAQYGRNGGLTGGKGAVTGYTVRTAKYRYTAWVSDKNGNVVAKEFYDLVKDPNESVNVADEKSYAAAVKEAEATRRGGWKSVRDAVK